MLDARAWLVWVLTALFGASTVRNPLYSILLVLVTTVVGAVCIARDYHGPGQRSITTPLRFAALAIPLSGLFNALTVHFGDTPLLHLPLWLPLLGGPVTLEALIFGVQVGLMLTAVFAGFSVFNQVTPVRDLVKLTPRAFHEVGVVLSIALTLVPQTIRSLERIRQAQAVRGHRVRGLRDWPPIIVPLLVSGLERSMGLAEAMVARGYGSTTDQAQPLRTSAGLALGLLAVLGGWLLFLLQAAWRGAGLGLMAGGVMLILIVVWLAGRSVHHTEYRPRHWTRKDTLVVAGCAVALAVVMLPPRLGRDTLYYSPFPHLSAPGFDPLVGLGLLALLMPALVHRRSPHRPPMDEAPVTWFDAL